MGNENESCKHYAKEVLRAKISPMFAAYSNGTLGFESLRKHRTWPIRKLVKTWNGANNKRGWVLERASRCCSALRGSKLACLGLEGLGRGTSCMRNRCKDGAEAS